MKTTLINLILLFIWLIGTNAQIFAAPDPQNASDKGKSVRFTAVKAGIARLKPYDPVWRSSLTYSIQSKNEPPEFEEIEKRKLELYKTKGPGSGRKSFPENHAASTFLRPIIGTNFNGNGNQTGGCPHDNTIAISNAGKLISITNSIINTFDENGTLSTTTTLVDFYNNPNISTNICDPKVLYDLQADRFIFYTQTCDGQANDVILAFSTTNDPDGNWFYYILDGDLSAGTELFDYPKIGMTNSEFFYSGNLFNANSFTRAMVVQVEKSDGYNGEPNLDGTFYDNIPGAPFTIMPVSHGQGGSYGPNMFLVSTNVVSGTSSTVHLYEISGDINSNPTIGHITVNTQPYQVGTFCNQSGSALFIDNGDTRVLDGYFLNNVIHFVYVSDAGGAWNGINFNRLNVVSNTNQSLMIGAPNNFDFCYPAIANGSSAGSDGSSVIIFGLASPTIFPSVAAIAIDQNMEISDPVIVKSGLGPVLNCVDGQRNRWGDYFGSSRKYSGFPTLWMSGSFGNGADSWDTWITEIGLNVGINEPDESKHQAGIFPNPAVETFTTRFNLDLTGPVQISLLDQNGKVVRNLFEGMGVKGENNFSFNQAALAPGIYFVSVNRESKNCLYEKLVVAD